MLVYRAGNVETMFDPRITTARPRYNVNVPMVTARDGSPNRVINRPLKSPAQIPTTKTTAKAGQTDHPCSTR
jgi:hypothetical protein